ncbi:MAG: NAD(P)/FAD-dependent oxidoreductase [Ilumatobacteraceae bacterium]
MTQPLPESADVVIVGAGLAGLVAARTLEAAGVDAVLLEASDAPGGRVRSDVVDGFVLDRGFQVLLTAYPELERHLDLEALDLRRFEPGAMVWRNGRGHVVGDPFRRPGTLASTALAPVGSVADKARIALLRARLLRSDPRMLMRGDDMPTGDALRGAGFSTSMIERFFRPLVGGIQLDPALTASRRMFDVVFRTLAAGDSAVPAAGMGAISAQLAAGLVRTPLHVNTRVSSVEPGRVIVDGGGSIGARRIIVATEGPVASRLLGLPTVGSRSAGCVWFDADAAPVKGAWIVLDGGSSGPVLNVAVMSNVSRSYAPAGRHLIAAAMPGVHEGELEAAARRQLRGWWGPAVDNWRHIRTDRIPHGQPDQSPPFSPKKRVSLGQGMYVCGDHRDTGSIQGAMFSGRRCAEVVLADARMAP